MQDEKIEDGKLIFSPQVAKYLLTRGFFIIDIKRDRNDKNRTIFVFKKDERLLAAIQDFKNS